MPNIAAILREEICRLAKREIKRHTAVIKQAVVQYRRDIADLKRQLREQAKEIAFLKSQERKRLGQPSSKAEEPLESVRFSPRSVKAQRHRLRLSAADYGKLVGVSGLTVYHWEHGKARPQKERLAALEESAWLLATRAWASLTKRKRFQSGVSILRSASGLPRPAGKYYLTQRQLFQGLRKRPGWYGWKAKSGGFIGSPSPPAIGQCYWIFHHGRIEELTRLS